MEIRECPNRPMYSVSDDGRIFSKHRTGDKPFKELRQEKIWTGYKRVRLATSGNYPYSEKVLVHVLVLEAFVGSRPSSNHEARHLDGNKQNNLVSNLAWGTARDNQLDKLRLVGNVLTEDDVREIKQLLLDGNMLQREIGEMFGVSRQTICDINNGRIWNHVQIGNR